MDTDRDIDEWIDVEVQEVEHVHFFRIREDGLLECTSDRCQTVITMDEFKRANL